MSVIYKYLFNVFFDCFVKKNEVVLKSAVSDLVPCFFFSTHVLEDYISLGVFLKYLDCCGVKTGVVLYEDVVKMQDVLDLNHCDFLYQDDNGSLSGLSRMFEEGRCIFIMPDVSYAFYKADQYRFNLSSLITDKQLTTGNAILDNLLHRDLFFRTEMLKLSDYFNVPIVPFSGNFSESEFSIKFHEPVYCRGRLENASQTDLMQELFKEKIEFFIKSCSHWHIIYHLLAYYAYGI